MDPTSTGLLLATLMICAVAIPLLPRLWHPERLAFHEYFLFWYGVYFGGALWVAYLLGGYRLAPVDARHLISAYEVLFLFVLGFWGIAGLLLSNRSGPRKGGKSLSFPAIVATLPSHVAVRPTLVLCVVVGVWALRLHLGKTYGLWLSGTGGAVARLPYSLVVASHIGRALVLGCVLWAAVTVFSKTSATLRFLALTIIGLEFFWYMARGRRWLLLGIILLAMGYLASGRRIKKRVVLLSGGIMLLVVSVIFPLFWSSRHIYFSRGFDVSGLSPVEQQNALMSEAWRLRDDDEIRRKYQQNIRSRPTQVVYFVAEVCRFLEMREPMGGALFSRSFYYSLPASLAPIKRDLLPPSQELLKHYGQRLYDPAISAPASFAADFGTPGGILGGVFCGIWLVAMAGWALAAGKAQPLTGFTIVAAILDAGFFVQGDVGSYFVYMRNLAVVVAILYLFDRPRFRQTPCARNADSTPLEIDPSLVSHASDARLSPEELACPPASQ